MKEMVGGCCVCSDERGWPENPLVYCDGQNCTVAVHQACYGIVTVPTGPWYCRKCESQERSARVRCELCPSRDGALKKTDNQGWAHVVCALYIPEVRFGNVTTMEPIILQLIPPERYGKTCYICQEVGKGSKANVGACMQCNKSGCKQQFHVTCAQALGLLCEEAGNYLDNVKYCGYCQHHYSKLKKGGNVKTIPPYKPITHETVSSDPPSSPEKDGDQPNINANTTSKTTSSTSSSSSQSLANTAATAASAAASGGSTTSASTTTTYTKQRKSGGTQKSSSSSQQAAQLAAAAAAATASASAAAAAAAAAATAASNNTIVNNPSATSNTSHSASHTSANNSSSNNTSASGGSVGGGGGGGGSSSSSTKSSSSSSKDKEKHSKSVSKVSSSSKNHDKEKSSKASKQSSNSSSSSSKQHQHQQQQQQQHQDTSHNEPAASMHSSGTSTIMPTNIKEPSQKSSSSSFHDIAGSQYEEPVPAASSGGSSSKSTTNSSSTSNSAKKRKADTMKSLGVNDDINKDLIKDFSVTLVPLPLSKTEHLDDKSSKKLKSNETTVVSSPLQNATEPNLQNMSPNLPSQPNSTATTATAGSSASTSVKHNVITQNTNNIMPSHIKSTASAAKEHLENNAGGGGGGGGGSSGATTSKRHQTSPYSQAQTATQSMVVSVPLATASVPGVNLLTTHSGGGGGGGSSSGPPAGGSIASGNSFQSMMHRTIEQNTPSNRGSPALNMHSHQQTVLHHHHSQQQLERQSPLVPKAVPSPSAAHLPMPPDQISASVQSNVLQNSANSPVSHNTPHLTGAAGVNMATGVADGGLKITYEKQTPNNRIAQLQQSEPAGRRSRTPETSISVLPPPSAAASTSTAALHHQQLATLASYQTASYSGMAANSAASSGATSFSGMRFSYEQQTPLQHSGAASSATAAAAAAAAAVTATVITPSSTPQPPAVKDSPLSSPNSEPGAAGGAAGGSGATASGGGSSRKRDRKSEAKDFKIFQNGIHATHMLGNQLNPASSVAQKMSDQLNMEMEAHSVYTSSSMDSQLIGPPFPGRQYGNRSLSQAPPTVAPTSLTTMLSGGGLPTAAGNTPQSLEQLLERQWEQGSQFLMEQAQHFDIASLLSCLHQLRTENVRLEEHVNNLVARRDHLLAVNARLAIPLNPPVPQQPIYNNAHNMNGPAEQGATATSSRFNRSAMPTNPPSHYQPQQVPCENGIDYRHGSSQHSNSGHNSVQARNPNSAGYPPAGPHAIQSQRQQPQSIATGGGGGSMDHAVRSSGASRSGTSNNNNVAGVGMTVNNSSSVIGGGCNVGASSSGYQPHSAIYNAVHQSALNRRDESRPKPS